MAPTKKTSRSAAKSLTTLFDKAAIKKLNRKQETTNDLMKRFFKSISPMYRGEPKSPSLTKIRRKTEPPELFRSLNLNVSSESGIDQFTYDGDVLHKHISLSQPTLKYKDSSDKSSSPNNSKTQSEENSPDEKEEEDLSADLPTNSRAHNFDLHKDKYDAQSNQVLISEKHRNTMKFIQMQTKHLRDPIFFSGVLKHRFDQKLKASKLNAKSNKKSIPESVLDGVFKRFNKKLIQHYQNSSNNSHLSQTRMASYVKDNIKSDDDIRCKKFWKKASTNCNFICPQVLPSHFTVYRDQFTVYLQITSSIENLQSQKCQKVNTIQCFMKLLKHLEILKKANKKFFDSKCTNLLTAQLYAKNLSSALSDAKTLATALLKDSQSSDDSSK